MGAEDVHATIYENPPRELGMSDAMALQLSVSALLGLIVTVIWGVTGGGYFWPMWVWFGLAVPLGAHAALRHALRTPSGRTRGIALHGALSGLVGAILVVVWAMAGGGTFWPLIPIAALGCVLALHAVIAASLGRPQERALEDRVDELTRTRQGALDVQAAELRRIERDLHDGAQARLVALSMQLGRAEARLDDRPEVADLLRQARGEASAAIAELRTWRAGSPRRYWRTVVLRPRWRHWAGGRRCRSRSTRRSTAGRRRPSRPLPT
jgi:signal transduction histidine kinase